MLVDECVRCSMSLRPRKSRVVRPARPSTRRGRDTNAHPRGARVGDDDEQPCWAARRADQGLSASDQPTACHSALSRGVHRAGQARVSSCAARAAKSRISDTRVLRVPAVEKAGRGVVVATERADRPVQACTSSGAAEEGLRLPERRAWSEVIDVGSTCLTEWIVILKRQIAPPTHQRID
jgi:hypothetical protein